MITTTLDDAGLDLAGLVAAVEERGVNNNHPA
jgi:hypothetical protein